MAKKVREQNKWTIPSDWDEAVDGFQLALICVPNSRQWRGIFAGQISDLAYGRNYNKLTGTITDAQAVARDIFESMTMTCLDDLVNALQCACENLTSMAEKQETFGQATDTVLSDGEVTYGPGEQFPDAEAYFNAKCNVSNGVYDTILGTVSWLKVNNADLLAGTFGGVTTGLVLGLALAGPLGWAIGVAGFVLSSLAGFLISFAVSFGDLESAIIEVHETAVLSLFNATNSLTAETNFVVAVDDATVPLTPVELGLLELVLSAEMLNQLFTPREDMATYESADPIDCGTAPLKVWSWPAGLESWTFRDDSDNNGVASMSWDSADEALAFELDMPGGMVHTKAIGVGISPAISIPVDVGNSVQLDYSLPQRNNYETWKTVRVFFDDATQDEITVVNTEAGTLILSISEAKTIEKVEVAITLYSGVTDWELHETIDTYEVRIQ